MLRLLPFPLFSSLHNWWVALDILGAILLPLLNNDPFLKAKHFPHLWEQDGLEGGVSTIVSSQESDKVFKV